MEEKRTAAQYNGIIPAEHKPLNQDDAVEIDLLEVFFTLLHSWKALLMACLIGATLMGLYHTYMVTPTYQASTELYITNTDSMISLQDLQIGAALTDDYQNIITSRAVLNQVIEDLQLDSDYKQLGKLVKVSNPSGTHIIHTTVTTTDLALSRDIANDLLNVSIDRIYQIVGTSEPTIIDYSEAEAVEEVTPGILKYMAIGGLVGILIVAAIIIIKMMMDNTIHSDDDVEKYLQLPVLAAVPYFKEN
jgi:capsular polysaccharide biosynthesis protein